MIMKSMTWCLLAAFLNLDGTLAVVVMNESEQEQPFQLWLAGQAARVTTPAHSIMTLTGPLERRVTQAGTNR